MLEADGEPSAPSTSTPGCSATGSCLGRPVDDELANSSSASSFPEAEDPGKDIALYVNSPGGEVYAGLAIYDAMQHVRLDVSTICFGMGMSAAAMIVAAGAPGSASRSRTRSS